MELFERAKAVRLKSHHDKFLYADEDEVHVTQERDGSSPNARWAVETVPHAPGVVRLRGRYGRYLSASNEPFLLGMTGHKVLQAAAPTGGGRPDSSVEWEPVREGFQARLKTRYGKYLRANGGLPPWRNSVTHDVPHRTATQDWVLWDVEIVQVLTPGPEHAASAPASVSAPASPPAPELRPPPPPHAAHHRPTKSYTSQPPLEYAAPPEPRLSKLESSNSFSAPLHKVDGRAIHYHIADDKGNVDDDVESHSFTFNGTNLEELTHKLQAETGLDDIIICTRSPINGKLTPLRLQLPPNNAAMHIVLVRESSKDGAPYLLPSRSDGWVGPQALADEEVPWFQRALQPSVPCSQPHSWRPALRVEGLGVPYALACPPRPGAQVRRQTDRPRRRRPGCSPEGCIVPARLLRLGALRLSPRPRTAAAPLRPGSSSLW